MNVVNFAHGEFYTLGAFATYFFLAYLGIDFYSGVAAAMLVGIAIGALCERFVLRPLQGENIDTVMLVMIGVWIFMQNTELLVWGGIPQSIPHPFSPTPLTFGPIHVTSLRLFVFGVAFALIVGSYLAIQKTKLGKAMRATFQDREAAALMGVNIRRIHTVTFAFGSGLAAAAGALLGPIFLVYPSMGDLAALKAFSVVIMGGLGNFAGATFGGLMLGIAESLGAGYISSGYKDGIGFIMIIIVLLFRPAGLFARTQRVG
jgi:branched-chain amino acid transport system permease protein